MAVIVTVGVVLTDGAVVGGFIVVVVVIVGLFVCVTARRVVVIGW